MTQVQQNSSIHFPLEIEYYSKSVLPNGTALLPFYLYIGTQRCMLLNQKTGKTLFVSKQAAEQLRTGKTDDNLQKHLNENGFLYKDPQHKSTSIIRNPLPSFFLIDMTNDCNFNCTYCFRRHPSSVQTITDERLDAICCYIRNYCHTHHVNHIVIQPWGGEPLLQADKILYIRRFFSEIPDIQVRIVVETNGSLITSALAKMLFSHKIELSVSFDGLPELHNLQRKDYQGYPTSDQVIRGIKMAQQAGYRSLGGICVLTRNGVGKIKDIFEYCNHVLGLTNLRINPVRQTANKEMTLSPLTFSEITYAVNEIVQMQWKMYQQGSRLYETNTWERVNNILSGKHRSICRSCGCCGGYQLVSFSMNGGIYPCELTDWEDELLGNIDDQKDLCEIICSAKAHSHFFREKEKTACKTCPWWYFCQGGCTAVLKHEGRIGQGVDEKECLINQLIYPQIVKLLLSQEKIPGIS